MRPRAPFLPGFSRKLFGRPPVSAAALLVRTRTSLDALCPGRPGALFGAFLPAGALAFKAASGANSRSRTYTVPVTFWAFLGQVLSPGSACRHAVSKVQALCATEGLEVPASDTKAYCLARLRLPVRMLHRVATHVGARLCETAGRAGGGRTLVVDGSSCNMPDTGGNQAKYPQRSCQKPGCGFPVMKFAGLFCLETGAWLAVAKSHFNVHESRLFNLVRSLMARSGAAHGRASFKGTLDRVATWSWPVWSAPSKKKAAAMVSRLLELIADDEIPERPGRREPRAQKKRPKTYPYLTRPRHQFVEVPHRGRRPKAA